MSTAIVKQSIIFMANLEESLTETELYEFFKGHPVGYIKIVKDHNTKKNCGYGFVGFKNASTAEKVLAELNYQKVKGRTIRLQWYNRDTSGARNNLNCNVFVKNLSDDVTALLFHAYFSQFGNVVSTNLSEDEFGEHYNYGFVLYESEEEANVAISKAHGVEWLGKKIFAQKIEKNRTKKEPTYTNVFVSSIPKDLSEETILAKFAKYGEITSSVIRTPSQESLNKLPEEKRKEIETKKYAFINFANPESAKKVIDEVSYHKQNNSEYNARLEEIASHMGSLEINERDKYRAASKFIEYYPQKSVADLFLNGEKTDLSILFKNRFDEDKKDFGERIMQLDKEDKLICNQALRKKERIRAMKRLTKIIKARIKKRYALCNLYVKDFPQEMTDQDLFEMFKKFGEIRSFKTVKHEPQPNNLGIQREPEKRYGFVCYFEPEAAAKCKAALQPTSKANVKDAIYVSFAEKKEDRELKKKIEEKRKLEAKQHQLALMNQYGGLPQLQMPNLRQFPPNMQGYGTQMINPYAQQQVDFNSMNEDTKREFLGENFYERLMNIEHFAPYEPLFGKITGVFLDLTDDDILRRLLFDPNFFMLQVQETISLLTNQQQN